MTRYTAYRHSLILLCCLCAAPHKVAAQADTLFLPVAKLFEQGLRHSLQLQADRMKESVAGEQARSARTARFPELQIGLRGGFVGQPLVWQRGLSGLSTPDVPDWAQNYAVDLTQPIYQGGRIKNNIRKADLEKQIAYLQTLSDRSELKLGLLDRYLNLFSLYKQHEVLSRNIDESEHRLRDIRRMKQEGLITDNDVLRSELQLTNDRLSLRETDNSIALVSQQLDILLGQDESLLLKPDTSLLYQASTLQTYGDYLLEAYADEPSMQLLRKQTELARNEVRLTQAASRPNVALYASNTLARPIARTLEDMYNNNWNLGLSISYPLSSLYTNRHRIKAGQIMVLLRENAEEQKKQNIRMEVRSAFLRHQEALQRVDALKLSVRQADENYRIMQNRYLGQLAILTDLLDANTVRLNAELQLITARTRVVYTYYQLQKACGRL